MVWLNFDLEKLVDAIAVAGNIFENIFPKSHKKPLHELVYISLNNLIKLIKMPGLNSKGVNTIMSIAH